MNAAHRSQHAKTSTDILRERDELEARVVRLEAVLSAIGAETQVAFAAPEIAVTALCRIEALVRRVSGDRPEETIPISELRPLRRA
jgi:hypothetical protein